MILNSFNGVGTEKNVENIKKEQQKALDLMMKQSVKLEKLIKSNGTGWQEFCLLINDYIDKCKKRKAVTALDIATDKEINLLKKLDHEVYILSWVLKIPEQFIGKVDDRVQKMMEDDEEE